MVTLQILNKVLEQQDLSIITNNDLTAEYFTDYADEYNFICEHFEKYSKVCDRETFLKKFPDFQIFHVTEPDSYLLETIREEHLYSLTVPIINQTAKLMQGNTYEAMEYLFNNLKTLDLDSNSSITNIIKQADTRLTEYEEKLKNPENFLISTGFSELDNLINGFERGEDFLVLFARTGQGKSWVLCKMATHVWQLGYNIGYISPEMSPVKIGYRFDTLFKNFSNRALIQGKPQEGYAGYIQALKTQDNLFMVATPKDFNKRVTVSKLKNFIIKNELDVLFIDGIQYLKDERAKKGDNKTTALTNISEDIMALSLELKIPIAAVVQSNRGGTENDMPELENIRDSDGIAHNATKVISIKQQGPGLCLAVKKNREAPTGGKLIYKWDIDKGLFEYVPSDDDSNIPIRREQRKQEIKQEFNDGDDVF